MSINKDHGRQYPLSALLFFGQVANAADPNVQVLPGDATVNETIDLPIGAIVTGGEVVVTTAFNPTGTGAADVADVGDAGSNARYKSAVDLTTLGRTALVPTGYVYTAKGSITVKRTSTVGSGGAAATTGAGYIRVEYVMKDRALETQAP